MKKILFSIIAASALLITGCGTSSYYASSDFQDGIYYRASKEDFEKKELENKEVLYLINKTVQQAKAFADTLQYASAEQTAYPDGTTYRQLQGISGTELPWETNPSYWDYNYPWNFYANGYWSDYYRWGHYPGYYGWGYTPYYYTWDPWFYGPNTPWGPSAYFAWGWDPWYYGPSWSFYYGYWGGPWDPYWGWGYYPHCHYPPYYAGGGSETGYYYGRRDKTNGGSLASGSRRAVGVRGEEHGSSVRGRQVDNSSRPKLNVVRGKDVSVGQVSSGTVQRGGIERNRSFTSAGTVQRRDNLGENYVFRGQQNDRPALRGEQLRGEQGIRRESPSKGNFRKSEQTGNRTAPDFNRSNGLFRSDSWGSTVNTSRNDRSTSTYRSSSSSYSGRSSVSSGGSVRSSGGSGGGGRSGPRR